ncbi:MAG: hypothetical protein ACI9G5_000963 [Paracoccaceae bacterium]|jgi:hypothetical protein
MSRIEAKRADLLSACNARGDAQSLRPLIGCLVCPLLNKYAAKLSAATTSNF